MPDQRKCGASLENDMVDLPVACTFIALCNYCYCEISSKNVYMQHLVVSNCPKGKCAKKNAKRATFSQIFHQAKQCKVCRKKCKLCNLYAPPPFRCFTRLCNREETLDQNTATPIRSATVDFRKLDDAGMQLATPLLADPFTGGEILHLSHWLEEFLFHQNVM